MLYKDEALNSLMIKCCEKAMRGGDTDGWFCALAEDDTAVSDRVSLVAMRTPPFNLQLYSPEGGYRDEDLREIDAMCPNTPGVIGSVRICEAYSRVCGKRAKRRMDLNLMVLEKCAEIPIADGIFRRIERRDLDYLPRWMCSFNEECQIQPTTEGEQRESMERGLDTSDQYVLEVNGEPVSTAAASGQMRNGIKIGAVYTPPKHRGKGYATSCVHRLAEMLIERGNKFVVLNADAKNPVSNHVYNKIGFENHAFWTDFTF